MPSANKVRLFLHGSVNIKLNDIEHCINLILHHSFHLWRKRILAVRNIEVTKPAILGAVMNDYELAQL